MTTPSVSTDRRDALLAAASRMAPLGVQLLATPAVLAVEGPEAYAAWGLMMTTINLLLVADLGVVGVIQRYHGVARGRGDTDLAGRVTATVLLVLGLLLVVVTLAGPWISDAVLTVVRGFEGAVRADAALLFRHAGSVAVLQLVALALSSHLAAQSRFLAVAGASIGARTVLAGGITVSLLGGHGLAGLLLAAYADAVVAIVLGAVLARRHLLRDVRRPTYRRESGELWSYAWRNQVSALGFVAQRELDVLMAGVLLPTTALAAAAATAPLAAAVSLAPLVLLTPLFTRLSVQAGASPEGLAATAAEAERSWFELVLPFAAVVLGVVPFAAAAWIGPTLPDLVPLTALLCAGFLLALANGVRAVLVRAAGRPGIETRSYVVHATVKIVAGTGLALVAGLLGLAAAGVLAGLAALVVLRRGARPVMAGAPSAVPRPRDWVLSALVLLGCAAASASATALLPGRWALVGHVLAALAGAAVAFGAYRTRATGGTAPAGG